MKLIKKITAAVTAMALAASMMSIGASAWEYRSWAVHYYSYAPTSSNVYYTSCTFYYDQSPITSYLDHCNNFNGSGPYVKCWGDVYDANDNFYGIGFYPKTYFGTDTSTPSFPLSNFVSYPGYYLLVAHQLINGTSNIWADGETWANT